MNRSAYLSRPGACLLLPALVFVLAAFVFPSCGGNQAAPMNQRRPGRSGTMMMGGPFERTVNLNDLWFIQSSAKVKAGGEAVSQPGFKLEGWYPAEVPSTVMGTLVQNGLYPDIFVGENLKSVSPEPFQASWWYRREFVVPPGPATKNVRLEFDGVNYRANVWLNGKKMADAADLYGAFRRFSIDVTAAARPGDKNVVAIEVFPPKKDEFTIGFVDWNPKPPDSNMGLWREVRVRTTGEVAIDHPFVTTKLDLENFKEARLTVSAELRNNADVRVSGTLEGRVDSGTFKEEVTLEPGETRKVVLTPESHSELVLKDPKVWWTYDLGRPDLYTLSLVFRRTVSKAEAEAAAAAEEAKKGGEEEPRAKPVEGPWATRRPSRNPLAAAAAFSDVRTVRFGVREVSDYINEQGFRGFKLNGRKILVRGGGWVDDLFLDNRSKKLRAQVLYARQTNLNTLRLEGFWGTSEELYNLCDANGILIMVGWSCQWEWENYGGKPNDEFGCIKTPEDIRLIADSWRDQVLWLRNHPSIFVWMEGSDTNPRPELEKEYLAIMKEDDPTRPALISAKERTSSLTGKSAVKMRGPYDYEPPDYWYLDTENGGAFGFNTETGPGPQVPPLGSLEKMIPAADLWPINDVWYYHCARNEFAKLTRYNEAMDKRLGPPKDLEDYVTKAQFLNYEAMRAMFEAFVANRYKATGVIQWMYNAAWPKLWWQLFDYYLNPNGAFYGARKAGEPLHLIYNYGTREVVASNLTREPAAKLRAEIHVFDLGLEQKYAKSLDVSLAADDVKVIDTLPAPDGLTTTYFLDLRLLDEKGRLVDSNFYCLSTKPDSLDTAAATWFVTPVKTYADLTALQNLKTVGLDVKDKFSQKGARYEFTVDLENATRELALQVSIGVVGDISGREVLPIYLDDNYFTLLPGEKRRIAGLFDAEDLGGEKPVLKVGGWNVAK
jgi:exo-1,4-beta-D-glucosaminidase